MGYYRFLENEEVSLGELAVSLGAHCQEQVEGLHVLSVSDTSEINLTAHTERLKPKGIGVVGNNQDIGFFIHPTLVLNGANGFPLGISDVQMWTRDSERPDKKTRQYQQLPIEEKESVKWLNSAQTSERYLRAGGAKSITHIGDREADIYEEWVTVPNKSNHLLIRACQDRWLVGNQEKLFAHLSRQPCEGTYSFTVMADARKNRSSREAWMAVRCSKVEIPRPVRLEGTDYSPTVKLYAVEALEVSPPAGVEPVHWRLLTTHTVVSLEQALQVITWYSWRWKIEQLFATLKQGGLNIEASQLETVLAIQRLSLLALGAAVRVLQLSEGREDTNQSAGLVFSELEQQCLTELSPTLNGTTPKQQNPYPPNTLAWATWLIARLGGWSGYRSQRPPGTKTLFQGLQKFESIFLGWKLARHQVVCTQ